MPEKFICGDSHCLLEDNVIFLPVSFTGLPGKITIAGCTLVLKTKFHISLVCIGKIIEKHNISIPDFQEKIVADFCEFTKHHSIDLIRYRDEFRFVTRDEDRTVVVMCEVSNLNTFFDLLNKKYALKLEHPPTHVTLYTMKPNGFISLTDPHDIEQKTKIVQVPEISNLVVR